MIARRPTSYREDNSSAEEKNQSPTYYSAINGDWIYIEPGESALKQYYRYHRDLLVGKIESRRATKNRKAEALEAKRNIPATPRTSSSETRSSTPQTSSSETLSFTTQNTRDPKPVPARYRPAPGERLFIRTRPCAHNLPSPPPDLSTYTAL